MDNFIMQLYRFLFVVAFILAGLGVLEGALQLAGQSLLRGTYTAGRLFEFSGIVMLFVIALELRDMRKLAASKQH